MILASSQLNQDVAWAYPSNQPAPPFTATIGDRRTLELEYGFDFEIQGSTFYMNPCLFATSAQKQPATYTEFFLPEYGFRVDIPEGATTGDTLDMDFFGTPSEDVYTYLPGWPTSARVEVLDSYSVRVQLSVHFTADTKDYIRNAVYMNARRFLANSLDNVSVLSNTGTSAYNSSKYIGAYAAIYSPDTLNIADVGYVERTGFGDLLCRTINLSPGGGLIAFDVQLSAITTVKCEIRHNGGVVASTNMFAGVQPFDLGSGSNVNCPTDDNYLQFSKGPIPDRISDFEAETGLLGIPLPAGFTYVQRVWWVYTPADYAASPTATIYMTRCDNLSNRIKGIPTSSASTSPVFEQMYSYLPITMSWYSTGMVVDMPVLSSDTNTAVNFITVPDACHKARYLVFRTDSVPNTIDFIQAYDYNSQELTVLPDPVLDSGVYKITSPFVFNAAYIDDGATYRILLVTYNTSTQAVRSYVSDEITAQADEVLCIPTISGSMFDLLNEYPDDYVEFAPNQRIGLELRVEKTTCNIFKSGMIGLPDGGSMVFGASALFSTAHTATEYVFRYILRLKHEWRGTDIEIKWVLMYQNEPTTIEYYQWVKVSDEQQEITSPIVDDLYAELSGAPIDSWCDVPADACVDVIAHKIPASPDYYHIAVTRSGFYKEEEVFTVGTWLPAASDTALVNTEPQWVDDEATYQICAHQPSDFIGVVGLVYPVYYNRFITLHYKAGGLTALARQITEAMKAASVSGVLGASVSLAVYRYAATEPGLATGAQPYAVWKSSLASAAAGQWFGIDTPFDPNDYLFVLDYKTLTVGSPTSMISVPFSQYKVGLDTMLPFRDKVTFMTTHTGILAAVRTAASTSYTDFPFDLSTVGGLALLNSAITATTGEYAVHLAATYDSGRTDQSVQVTNPLGFEYIAHVSEDYNPDYNALLQGNASSYNGSSQYDYITGFDQTKIDRGSKFTLACCFSTPTPLANMYIVGNRTSNFGGFINRGFVAFLSGGYIYVAFVHNSPTPLWVARTTNRILAGRNFFTFEFNKDKNNVRMTLNGVDMPLLVTIDILPVSWSINNGKGDLEIGVYSSQTAGTTNYFNGDIRTLDIYTNTLTDNQRRRAHNTRGLFGIVSAASLAFSGDFNKSGTDITPNPGTGSFTSVRSGGYSNNIFL